MEEIELNNIIKKTIKLGEDILYKVVDDTFFNKYKKSVNDIAIETLRLQNDRIKIRTCEIILETNIKDLRLNIWQKIFNQYHRTGVIFFPNNSVEQLHRRYILSINSNLPILIKN